MGAKADAVKELVIDDFLELGYPTSGVRYRGHDSKARFYFLQKNLGTFGMKRKKKNQCTAHAYLCIDAGVSVSLAFVVNGKWSNNIVDYGTGIYIADVHELAAVWEQVKLAMAVFIDNMQFNAVR